MNGSFSNPPQPGAVAAVAIIFAIGLILLGIVVVF